MKKVEWTKKEELRVSRAFDRLWEEVCGFRKLQGLSTKTNTIDKKSKA